MGNQYVKPQDLKKSIRELTEIRKELSSDICTINDRTKNKLTEIIDLLDKNYKECIKEDLKENVPKYFAFRNYAFDMCLDEFLLEKCDDGTIINKANNRKYTIGDFIGKLNDSMRSDKFIEFMNSYATDIEYVLDVAIEYREEVINAYSEFKKEKEKEEDGE